MTFDWERPFLREVDTEPACGQTNGMSLMMKQETFSSVASHSSKRLLREGVASIDVNQRMSLSRKRAAEGSIADDWKIVGKDLRRAIDAIKREYEPA
jgi:hypothetical protein